MIPLFKVFMPKTVKKPLLDTLFSGYIGQGQKVEEFEDLLKGYIGNPRALTLNSATSALHLSMQLANVGFGDEVISTALTCTATNWPILAQGAKIVWADIDPGSGNIDPKSIQKKISEKTKAIVVVDWGGQPVDINSIKKIAYKKESGKKIKIPIIEDAAHAFGAIYHNKKVGNLADYTVFSFQAIKHITTVDGGLLLTTDKKSYERGKLLRWYGINRSTKNRDSRIEEDVKEWGYKFHMNDINATIGIEQMKYIDGVLQKHRANAKYYYENLEGVNEITLLYPLPNTVSSNWIFTMKVKKRDKFRIHMQKSGIATSQVHRRNDTHPTVKMFRTKLPQLDVFEKEMICIPVGWWVTEKNREFIVKTIKKGW